MKKIHRFLIYFILLRLEHFLRLNHFNALPIIVNSMTKTMESSLFFDKIVCLGQAQLEYFELAKRFLSLQHTNIHINIMHICKYTLSVCSKKKSSAQHALDAVNFQFELYF